MGQAIMLQGTGSDVGKSVLVSALCRIFSQDGYRVAPFKSQNMALNSGVTIDHKEIGRAQYVQAEAARIEPTVDMNPILLKPYDDTHAQVIVRGESIGNMSAKDYIRYKPELLAVVKQSLESLKQNYDIVVIEGAGSPAEVNLREHDLVNMPVAKLANAAVFLVANIDLGGVFAYVAGTLKLLLPDERALVKGIIVNKFRGEARAFLDGRALLEDLVGIPVAGVIPYIDGLDIPEEDAIPGERTHQEDIRGQLKIGVIHLPHISNFTDFDALKREPSIDLQYVKDGQSLADCDLIILPGTKNTIGDLQHLYNSGLAEKIKELANQGVPVFGVCGGYQMLGQRLSDPEAVESDISDMKGLGLLPLVTQFYPEKVLRRTQASVSVDHGLLQGCKGCDIKGYEIHMGQSKATGQPWLQLAGGSNLVDGLVSENGRVIGTYLHGVFDQPQFRQQFIHNLLADASLRPRPSSDQSATHRFYDVDKAYDHLAACVRENLDLDLFYRYINQERGRS